MPRKRILTDEQRKINHRVSSRKSYRKKYRNDMEFRENERQRIRKIRDSKSIKRINTLVKINSRGYPNLTKDFYTLEELDNYD